MTTFEPNVPGIYQMPAADYHAAPGVELDAAHYKNACDRIARELDGALL